MANLIACLEGCGREVDTLNLGLNILSDGGISDHATIPISISILSNVPALINQAIKDAVEQYVLDTYGVSVGPTENVSLLGGVV